MVGKGRTPALVPMLIATPARQARQPRKLTLVNARSAGCPKNQSGPRETRKTVHDASLRHQHRALKKSHSAMVHLKTASAMQVVLIGIARRRGSGSEQQYSSSSVETAAAGMIVHLGEARCCAWGFVKLLLHANDSSSPQASFQSQLPVNFLSATIRPGFLLHFSFRLFTA